jgi:hypothetical protein
MVKYLIFKKSRICKIRISKTGLASKDRGHDRMDLQLPMQLMPITTDVVSCGFDSRPGRGA